jgi:hypothetical protein
LDINPDLDYIWLIEVYIGEGDPFYCGNRVYRKINDEEYILIGDIPMDFYYLDAEADPDDLNCYMVTDLYAKNEDTCESSYSNESCVQPVSIFEEDEDGSRLIVYPNPAHDRLYLEMQESMEEVQLLDMTGRVLYKKDKASDKLIIPVDSFEAGIYLIKVMVKEELVTRKILIR